MYKLFLDQATVNTGISLFSEDNELLNHYTFVAKDKDIIKRITELIVHLWQNELTLYSPDELKIYLEGIQLEQLEYQSKDISVDTFKKLAWLQGALLEKLNEMGYKCEIIPPSVWKSKVGIFQNKRKEQKKAAQDIVKMEFEIDVTEDEADSICMGLSTFYQKKSAW